MSNSGTKTFIGQGNKKDIIYQGLQLRFDKPTIKIVDFRITNSNFPVTTDSTSNTPSLGFKQWKSGESVEVTFITENTSEADLPGLKIDELDIINGSIKYSELQTLEENKPKRLIDRLPGGAQRFFWWCVIFQYGILQVSSIVILTRELKKPGFKSIWQKTLIIAIVLVFTCFFYLPLLWMI